MALPFPQAPDLLFPGGFLSAAAAGVRRVCLDKAASVSPCLLYLETQDKHKGARWPRSSRKAVWGRQRWEHADTGGNSVVFPGVIYCRLVWHHEAAIVLTAREIVWPGSCKAFLWINLVLPEKENKKNKIQLKKKKKAGYWFWRT